jgi:pimeloyl-ACP methyl ester carboxylesterase
VPADDVSELDYPVLVIHGEADSRTPVSQGLRVYENAPPGSQLWIVPGAEHVDAFQDHPDEYVARVVAYFDSRLGGTN